MRDVDVVLAMIVKLPPDSQLRVEAVATILRGLLAADDKQEVEIAFTLVMAELAE